MDLHKETTQLTLSDLIDGLTAPSAYPFPVDEVELRQTHISAVFLAGDYVYKVKKPVDYGFLDFGTLEKRRHYCEEEVRLNRRLAPDVYLGVVPVTQSNEGICFEGEGDPIEWAVKMRRLPDEATLQLRLRRDEVGDDVIRKLACRIAEFHANAESGPHVSKFGRFSVVLGNARENFYQSMEQIGSSVSENVFWRVAVLTEQQLACDESLIESRAERGVSRDTHGDLRLGHVYIFPDQEPPNDLLVIDCIEFTERFRFADPIADVAFLIMGLHLVGRRNLANEFLNTYVRTSGDEEGRKLIPFYAAYRATVRGKVEGLKLTRPELTEAEREVARTKARGSWLLALGELEKPERTPCLLLVAGLPGTGKSTLAQAIAEQASFQVIRSDVVRKELAGVLEGQQSASPFGQGIYTAEWTQRTYTECLRRAKQSLFQGSRVLVDANFRSEADRQLFFNAAIQLGVRTGALICEADADTVRERLANRRGDASDADWSIYECAAADWEAPSTTAQTMIHSINTGSSLKAAVAEAGEALRQWKLA